MTNGLTAALRYIRRNRRYAFLEIGILTMSVAAIAVASSLFSAVTLSEPEFRDANMLWVPQLMAIPPDSSSPQDVGFSYNDFESMKRSLVHFESAAAYVPLMLPLGGERGPQRVRAEFVSPEFFSVLQVEPEVGGLPPVFGSGGERTALLSERLWRSRFDADLSVVDSAIQIFGLPLRVIGVLPQEFSGLTNDVDLWIDMPTLPVLTGYADILSDDQYRRFGVVFRAQDAVSERDVRRDVVNAGNAIAAERPERNWAETSVQTLAATRSDPSLRRVLRLLLVAASMVLLVAALNIAGLRLSRAKTRAREFALREAVGASGRHIMAQVLGETGVVAFVGALFGVGLASVLVRGIVAVLPRDGSLGSAGHDLDRLMQATTSPSVVAFVVFAAGLSALITGAIVTMDARRRAQTEPLVRGRSGQAGGSASRFLTLGGRGLVAIQVAVTGALLSIAAILFVGLVSTLRIDPGFDGRSVLALDVVSSTQYDPAAASRFHRAIIEAIAQLPGVGSAAIGSCIPLDCRWMTAVGARGSSSLPDAPPTTAVGAHFVSPGYFRTLGVPVLEGREFTDRDERGTKRVVVVSGSLAERLWPNEAALGRQLAFEDDSEPAEVVGIVGEVRQQSLESPRDEIYIADYQNGAAWGVLFVKAEVPLQQLIEPMRKTLLNVDPGLPFEPREEVDERLAREAYRGRYALGLTAVLASIALLLTLLGIYGAAATIANSRSVELAVRTAVGARPSRLWARIVSVALLPVAAGTAAGLPLAWALGRWLGAMGHSGAADLASPTVESHVFVPLAMLGAALVACLVAAKQALKREPWTQLTKNV